MQVTATAKFVRLSPRKTRLLLATVKGMPAEEAVLQLQHRPHAAAKPLAKLIKSAASNAEHNFSLDPKNLVIETLTADEGPVLKRFKPVSRGRAQNIRRPTAHLKVVLKDVSPDADEQPKAGKKPAKTAKAAPKKSATTPEPKPKVESKAGDPKTVKHQKRSDDRAEVKQVAPRKSARQTGRGGDK
jgi:large subunit ribosomal protein L22